MDQSNSLTTSIVVTNYNTWELTVRCVAEFCRWSKGCFVEIVVVDDGSDQQAPAFPDHVRVIRNETNRGYVASVNIGFRESRSDIVLLFDSDARPSMDLVLPVQAAFSADPTLGALGFALSNEDGTPGGSSEPRPDVASLLLGQKVGSIWPKRFRQPASEDVLYSCAVAIRRRAFDDIGGFDESFDFLDADCDFSWRLRGANWTTRIDRLLTAIHQGGGSPQATSHRVLRFHRNRWRLLAKHGRISHPHLLKVGLGFRHLLEYGLLRVLGRWLVPNPDVRADKLHSRRQLLKIVWNGYGNDF